jgi:transposase-like protein
MDVLIKKRGPGFPRMLREQIVQEYLSGRKTGAMLAKEYGVHRGSVNKMVSRYYQKNRTTFAETIIQPIMQPKKVKPTDYSALQLENEQLRRQLQLAQLKIEGYQTVAEPAEASWEIFWRRNMGLIC